MGQLHRLVCLPKSKAGEGYRFCCCTARSFLIFEAVLEYLYLSSLSLFMGEQLSLIFQALFQAALDEKLNSTNNLILEFVKKHEFGGRVEIASLVSCTLVLTFHVIGLVARSKELLRFLAWCRYICLCLLTILYFMGLIVVCIDAARTTASKRPEDASAQAVVVTLAILFSLLVPLCLLWEFFVIRATLSYSFQLERLELLNPQEKSQEEYMRGLLQEAPTTYASTV